MAKDRKRLVLPHEYLDAKMSILNMRAGRNIDTRDLSSLPKAAAQNLLNTLAEEGIYLKSMGKGRWQRTNASSKKIINEIKNDTDRSAKAAKKPVQPKPYNTPKVESKNMDKQKREELDAIKARIVADRKKKASRVEQEVELERAKAQLAGKPFDYEASWNKNYNKLYPKSTPEVKADIDHSSSPQVNKPSSRELNPADYLEPFGGLIGNADLVSFRDGKSINLSGVSAVSAVSLQAEGTLLTGSDISFDGVSVAAHKVGNRFAISNELLEDNPAVVGSSVRAAQQALTRYFDAQALSGSDIVSGSNIADHALIPQRAVTNVASFTLNDLNAVCAAHDNEGEDLILALNPSFYSSVIQDLQYASAFRGFERVGSEIYYGSHRVVFSNAIGGPSASASGTVLAVAGSLKDGLVLAERSPLSVSRHDQILAANDKTLYFCGGRYGIAVRRPEALARIEIA